MGRSDRLYALVEELRARAPRIVPRHELAERLEVSARTIERDILTLQQAGVPIWTQRGRFGGYAIEQSTTLPPLNFEPTEALAVMASLSVLPNHPFAAAGRRAQQKLLAAMRESDVVQARELATRIRTVTPHDPPPDNEVMRNVERAVVGRRVVELVYGDRKGASTTRTVEAHGLHLTSRAGYLIGWCRLRDAGRAFRLDRIEKAVIQDEVAPERDLDPMLDWVDGATSLDTTSARTATTTPAASYRRHRPVWCEDDTVTEASAHATAIHAVRSITATVPGVEEHDHHGRPAWRLGPVTFAAAQDGDRLWVEAAPGEITARTAASPDVYERHYGLTIRLDRVDAHELRRLVLAACRLASMSTDQALTWTDVAEVAAGLPGVAADGERHDLRHGREEGHDAFASLVDGSVLRVRLHDAPESATALALADPLSFRADGDAVLVDLESVGRARLTQLLAHAAHHPQGDRC